LLDVAVYLPSEHALFMGFKRTHDGNMADKSQEQSASPYMAMFEGFRKELDEHHDRRERIVKASRDITASSKKMYGN
jgi:hypothetical protein